MNRTSLMLGAIASLAFASGAWATALLNEFHYDDAGADEGEFIEVVLDGGTDPADVDVHLYNGVDHMYYSDTGTPGTDIFNVGSAFVSHGTLGDGKDYYSISLPVDGLQNGAPDAIAVTIAGGLIEFLSYEGAFTGSGGPADGIASTNIGAAEPASAPEGSSLQRLGFGTTWMYTAGSNTQGAVNVPEPATLALLGLGGLALIRRR